MRYVHLIPSGRIPLTLAHVAGSVRGAKVCNGCVHYTDAPAEIHVVVQDPSAGRHGLNIVQGCNLGVAKTQLLAALSPEVTSQLFLGTVTSETGRELRGVRTFRAKRSILVRADAHADFRYCPDCGRLCYFALGKSYLYPAPPADVCAFDSGLGGLVIRADCFRAESFPKFTGVRIEELGVASEPSDGFAEIAPAHPPELR